MARAAADNLGTHTMDKNHFTCKFPTGTLRFKCHECEVGGFANDETADRIGALAVGETLVDEDGDTWERIA